MWQVLETITNFFRLLPRHWTSVQRFQIAARADRLLVFPIPKPNRWLAHTTFVSSCNVEGQDNFSGVLLFCLKKQWKWSAMWEGLASVMNVYVRLIEHNRRMPSTLLSSFVFLWALHSTMYDVSVLQACASHVGAVIATRRLRITHNSHKGLAHF